MLTLLLPALKKAVVANIALDLESSQPFLKVSKHFLTRNLETESKLLRLIVLLGSEGSSPNV